MRYRRSSSRRLGLAALSLLLVSGTGFADPPKLVEAAKRADWKTVVALVDAGSDVNTREGDGTTALHWASYWDELDVARRLVAAGGDVDARNDLGATPLWPASLNGSSAMVRLLLDAGADATSALLSGETLVMTASRSGNADVVQQLLEAGADPNSRATRGQTALMWAASQGHADVVRVLVRHGADVHARSEVWRQLWQTDDAEVVHPDLHVWIDHGGLTPLLFAARSGDLATARALVEAGADVNDRAAYGISATVYAVHSGSNDLLGFLLENGADPNADEAGYSAVHAALLRRNPDGLRLLLEHGADPNAPLRVTTPVRRTSDDFYFHPAYVGASPFWLAARFLQPESMRLLAANGADPHFVHDVDYWRSTAIFTGFNRDQQGATTALMAAAGLGGGGAGYVAPEPADRERLMLECISIAVELGLDVNAVNADGRSAADAAAAGRYEEVVRFLVDRGARAPSQPTTSRGARP